MKKRIFEERTLTGRETKRRHDDKACGIDGELDAALDAVDWARRNRACMSFVDFVETYMVGLLLDEPPSEKMKEVMRQMESCLSEARPVQLLLPRGSGKTSISQCLILYCIASARRKFGVIVSQNHASAQQLIKDIFRAVIEPDSLFAQDFPELVLPFAVCDGSYRRRQLYRGTPTDITKTASQITFARLRNDNGEDMPTSGSAIICKGITSGIRGVKMGRKRPDLILLDDLQDAETAQSPEQIKKLLDIIRADILNLSSKGRINVLMTATPIAAEDLTQQIENDKGWKTLKYPAIITWPHDMRDKLNNGLWAQYFAMFDAENADDKPHTASREFYENNRAAMDDGAELFSPNRFKPEEHASALQALLDQRHLIGAAAFDAEYQMAPKRISFALDITPQKVLRKVCDTQRLIVPDGYLLTIASTDINASYGLTTVIVSFKPDSSAHTLYHGIHKCRIPSTLPPAEYNQRIIAELGKLQDELLLLGVKIDAWAIDGSGIPFDAVCAFSKSARIPTCAFLGRASHVFNPYSRSKLRDAIGDTILCGDAREHVKSGSGARYVFWNADKLKAQMHKAIIAPSASVGSLSLYSGDANEHAEYALQICNERLLSIQHKADGRDVYSWTHKEPHDYLDATAQAYAAGQQHGISGAVSPAAHATTRTRAAQIARLMSQRNKPRIKIV